MARCDNVLLQEIMARLSDTYRKAVRNLGGDSEQTRKHLAMEERVEVGF